MKHGIFITFEGPEGSGKTTHSGLLCEFLRKKGFKILHTREPGGVLISEKIRKILLDPKNKGMDAKARKFLFGAIGKSHVLGETDGFIKLVVDNKSDKILGCQIIGPHATELIAEISVCVQFGITSEKLAGVIHAHPTLSEIICEVSSMGGS